MFSPVMLTAYELACGDIEYHLDSREGETVVLYDLDPVAGKVADAIIAAATTCYAGEYLEDGIVCKTIYLFE